MSHDIQINPTAPVLSISPALAELIEEHAVDFDIRYCALEPDPGVIAALRAIVPARADDAAAVAALLSQLELGHGVELLCSS
jgi:hypothetical protein